MDTPNTPDYSHVNNVLVRKALLDPSRESPGSNPNEVVVKLLTPSDQTDSGIAFPAAKAMVQEAVPDSKVIGGDLDSGSFMIIRKDELEQVRQHLNSKGMARGA